MQLKTNNKLYKSKFLILNRSYLLCYSRNTVYSRNTGHLMWVLRHKAIKDKLYLGGEREDNTELILNIYKNRSH